MSLVFNLTNRLALPPRALARLKRSYAKHAFDRVAAGILDTAPLCMRGDSPLFLSLLCHRDVISYLIAIKSLYTKVGHGRVAIINDGSLTESDLATVCYHVSGIEMLDISAIDTVGCPRGGCWERLVKIVELASADYVIQMDADTLTFAPISEVIECLSENRSFLLGTGSGRSVTTAPAAARMVRGWIVDNGWTDVPVGTDAEASLDRLPDAIDRSYVHASAGFAGFARGAVAMDDLVQFSIQMGEILGPERWQEWGSEQIASNYLLANAPEATVLPFPRYACFEPHLNLRDHAFLHFLGTYRYDRGVYKQRAAEFIASYGRLSKADA